MDIFLAGRGGVAEAYSIAFGGVFPHYYTYMKFVADAVDIVRGAKISMWSNFDQHDKFCLSCGSKLLHITSNFAPHGTIVCHLEQSYHVEQ